MSSRANTERDKLLKSEMIIEATIKLYEKQRKILTVNAIAQQAKIGKSTVYSYFKTKEEIYMESLVRSFSRWHVGVRNYILDTSPDEKGLIEFLCKSLCDFTVFVDLVSISSTVLEENLDISYLRDAKTRMQQETIRTANLMASTYSNWSKEEIIGNIRRFYLYGVAYWKECFPSNNLKEAMPQDYGSKKQQLNKFFNELLHMSSLIWKLEM